MTHSDITSAFDDIWHAISSTGLPVTIIAGNPVSIRILSNDDKMINFRSCQARKTAQDEILLTSAEDISKKVLTDFIIGVAVSINALTENTNDN